MIFNRLIATAVASLLLVRRACALDLKEASFHSFGGVNYPELAFLEPEERDAAIQHLVAANATVIRLFITGDEEHSDVEPNLGVFDEKAMRRFDDTLWSIYRISKGKTKVIIAPHDIHALRADSHVPCDAYCKKVGDSWLDFYSTEEMRNRYKQRLSWMFHHYISKNFKGARWGQLSAVILGVDLQHQPFEGVYPIPAGEGWLCDIAEHLKNHIGLGNSNIAVITGGISGYLNENSEENWPDSIWKCDAIDVIGVHGAFSSSETTSSGTVWMNRFLPSATFPARALGKKLVLVEQVGYVDWMHSIKAADVWDSLEALSFRGIPWLYASVRMGVLRDQSEIRFRGTRKSAIWALRLAMEKANISPTKFDWRRYVKPRRTLAPHTAIGPNQWKPYQNGCLFGCLGWSCDAMDGCASDLVCKNNVCQECTIGCPGMTCNSKTPCQEQYNCVNGRCQSCNPRSDTNDIHAMFDKTATQCPNTVSFPATPICNFCDPKTQSCRGAPCERTTDCDAKEQCEWGLCKPCKEGCLGMQCTSGQSCKSGHCNSFKRCDIPPKVTKPNTGGPVVGRRGPCGPGQDCNRPKGDGGLKPQPVLQGNAHSKGAGEQAAKAAQAGITAKPTTTYYGGKPDWL